MALIQHQKMAVRTASALLALYLIFKRLAAPISKGIFLYIYLLPFEPEIANHMYWAVLLLGGWCNAPFFEIGRSGRNCQLTHDRRRIIWATYLGLLFEMHRDNSFLGSFQWIQWISRLASGSTFLLLYFLSVTINYSSKRARALRTFASLALESFLVMSGLFFRAKFFEAQDWIYENRNLGLELATQYVNTLAVYVTIHLLFGVVVKLVWGSFLFTWRYKFFYIFLLGLLVQKTWGKLGEHRYRYPYEQSTNNQTSTTLLRYKYTPLPTSRHVRLLLLHARHTAGTVKCSLILVLLEDVPRFEAMSYTWGSLDKEFNVLVNGDEIPVTANAYNLLRDMSSYVFPRLIWIDSICIDQDNLSERAEQVSLMGELYSRASLVTIWLSTSVPKQSDDEDLADNLQAAMAVYHIKLWDAMESGSDNPSSLLKALGFEKLNPLWDATLKLVDNRYFERSWIIQEIVLATRVRVMYRRVEIGWDTFLGAVQRLNFSGIVPLATLEIDGETFRSASPSVRLSEIGQIQTWWTKRQEGGSISFRDVVFYARRFQATDLRDKIFAVRGLCRNPSEELTIPDYSTAMTVADVYLNATRRLIKEEGILRLFFAAGIGYFSDTTPNLESLPSWAPDWSRAFYCVPFSYLRPYLDYSAGGDVQSDSHQLENTSLFLSGHLFDTIVELAPPLDYAHSSNKSKWSADKSADKENWKTILASYRLILESSHVQKPYQHTNPPQTLNELFWRLIIGDRIWTHRPPAPMETSKEYLAFLQAMHLRVDAPEKINNKRSWDNLMALHDASHQYRQLVNFTLAQRRVCITRKGYVGLVPQFSSIGDTVVIVLGAQTPLVMRPVKGTTQESKYQLIGECYVHGIMYGEALAALNSPDIIEVV